ncbi:MAG: hypothetical protein WCG81_07860 [Candidatus Angelobacter sp.]
MTPAIRHDLFILGQPARKLIEFIAWGGTPRARDVIVDERLTATDIEQEKVK